MALALLKSQIVPLVEKFEPELESIFVKTVQSLKTSNPTEAELFYKNWKQLNAAVESQFATASPATTPVPTTTAMKGGDESTGPTGPAPPLPEPSPPIIEPTGPTGPAVVETTGPSFLQSTGASGPSIITQISEAVSGIFGSGPTGPMLAGERKLFAPNGGSYKAGRRRRGNTAKQHRKRTHRVKQRKH